MVSRVLTALALMAWCVLAVAQDAVDFSSLQPYTMWYSKRDCEHSRELLIQPLVQQDLQLSETASISIKALYDAAETAIRTASQHAGIYESQGKAKEFRAELLQAQELYRKFEDESYKLLTEPQRERLYELSVQQLGAELLDKPLTVKRLGMSEAQVTLFRKLFLEACDRGTKADKLNQLSPGEHTRAEWDVIVARSASIGEQRKAEIAAIPGQILTAAQMRIWRSLSGEPMRTAEIGPAAFPPPPHG